MLAGPAESPLLPADEGTPSASTLVVSRAIMPSMASFNLWPLLSDGSSNKGKWAGL